LRTNEIAVARGHCMRIDRGSYPDSPRTPRREQTPEMSRAKAGVRLVVRPGLRCSSPRSPASPRFSRRRAVRSSLGIVSALSDARPPKRAFRDRRRRPASGLSALQPGEFGGRDGNWLGGGTGQGTGENLVFRSNNSGLSWENAEPIGDGPPRVAHERLHGVLPGKLSRWTLPEARFASG
jgi:hypothetical protein